LEQLKNKDKHIKELENKIHLEQLEKKDKRIKELEEQLTVNISFTGITKEINKNNIK